MFSKKNLVVSAVSALWVLGATGVPLSATAGPDVQHQMTAAQDDGPTAPSNTITTSIILNVTDPEGLQNYVQATLTPSDPNYHRFLTVGQFRDRFAPSNHQIRQLEEYLESFGITVDKVYDDNLDITVTGTADQLNAAFSTQMHDYTKDGQRFHRPDSKPTVYGDLATLVLAVPGLSSESGLFRPMNVRMNAAVFAQGSYPPVSWPQNGTATGVPGDYTVGDVANFYQVNPLYDAGKRGQGQTVGIMTLANFNPADAESYWQAIGLNVKPNRIRVIPVDGGTPVQAGVGDDETSLDVEQSGGLAPQAKIRVYVAPNTSDGFIDLFYTAASENQADSVSISWGEAEEFYFAALNGGVDYTSQLQAIDQALMESAAQGQSVFAAAGDAGAYDVNRFASPPYYSKQLTVDSPANDPYITAAGGTTTPASLNFGSLGTVNITNEQVWGWDYLTPICAALGYDPVSCGIFPVGGGGGVSSFWPAPYYQQSVAGIQQTQPGQSLIYYPNYPSASGAQDLIDLPANFAGRNLPDLSLNADPETGYILVDCTDYPAPANPGCAANFFGGTSFVAPQLNGITALIDQTAHGRVGLLNPVVYTLQQVFGYGPLKAFNDITAGDNWFYQGIAGYDDGAGIGTINAANLAFTYAFLNSLDSDHHDH